MSALRGKADISVNFSYWTKSDIDFIQMPNRWGRFGSRRSRLCPFCICWPKFIDPCPGCSIGNINAAFDHKFFYISEAEIEAEIYPYGTTNNIFMEAVAEVDW